MYDVLLAILQVLYVLLANHVEIASRIFLLFNFRFGQEVKVNLGSPFFNYFVTIDDLYNGAKIVNLTSCGC